MALTRQEQAYEHAPDAGVYGDCWRTAMAMVLDVPRDDVPHVHSDDVVVIRETMRAFLAARGLKWASIPMEGWRGPGTDGGFDLEGVLGTMANINPGMPYILSGRSSRGYDHAMAALDRVVCDPHPSMDGVVGPCKDGWWWVEILVPLSVRKAA